MWRVVLVENLEFPAYFRLITKPHVSEFSELSQKARHRCADLISTIESTVIKAIAPTKMNLASLGNYVAHLHWHVIARFIWDTHYPEPIWASPLRDAVSDARTPLVPTLVELSALVRSALDLSSSD